MPFEAGDQRMSQGKERGEKKEKRKRRENHDFEFDCVAPRRVPQLFRERIFRKWVMRGYPRKSPD
jgi:hypothetical protein